MDTLKHFITKSFEEIDKYPFNKSFEVKGSKLINGNKLFIITGVVKKVFYYAEIRSSFEPYLIAKRANQIFDLPFSQ